MIRSRQLIKWTAIALSALVLGYIIFDKNVLPPQRQSENSGSATLSWAAPTENEDESSLTNLAGYVIHYTTPEGKYAESIYIDDPGTTTYTVENLTPGTYHFSISAVQSDGRESTLSNEMAKTIP